MQTDVVRSFISDARKIRQSIRKGHTLIVEDDPDSADILEMICKSIGNTSIRINNIEDARTHILLDYSAIKIAILDYIIEDEPADGLIELCQNYHIPCIVYTGRVDMIKVIETNYPGVIVILKSSSVERLIEELV